MKDTTSKQLATPGKPMTQVLHGICGTVMHTPVRGEVKIIEDALITFDECGIIRDILTPKSEGYRETVRVLSSGEQLTRLKPGQYLLPGLVDLHVHAPQWPHIGKALHLPLHEWLNHCTFPLEARYLDTAFANDVYESLVSALLSQGTTTAVYFGTIHVDATSRLARICHRKGQRAYVGRVAMDNPAQCPDYYRDKDATQAIDASIEFIEIVNALPQSNSGKLVYPVVTPRFIPSCTNALLQGLGDIAERYDCHIQTHCSESNWEHDHVINRFGKTDAQSLENFGLLTEQTILAHCNFVDDNDLNLFADRGSSIAHCPLSNFYFANTVFPLQHALSAGIKIGLGTDISGGPSASILDNCCHAVVASRVLEDGVNSAQNSAQSGRTDARVNFMESFWLATVGGAQVLGIHSGQFTPGYYFDAMMIDVNSPNSTVYVWENADTMEDIFQKIVYHARRPNIQTVWVGGNVVQKSESL